MNRTIRLTTEQDTVRLARNMLGHFQTGDVILLEGPVGVGKSTFARAVIQAQMAKDGQVEEVPSPTFTLIQIYETSRGAICHADLYRLSDSSELEELGFPELFDTNISLIEWPERLGAMQPNRHLTVSFSFPDRTEVREAALSSFGDGWSWMKTI